MTNEVESRLAEQIRGILEAKANQSFGGFLAEKFKERDVSDRQVSEITGIPRRSLQRILSGEAETIDAMKLLRLSEFLGVDMKILIHAYAAMSSEKDSASMEQARTAGFLTEYFDLKELKKSHFLEDARNYVEIEKRILAFFGLTTLREFASLTSLPLFSRTRGKRSNKMLTFWLAIVHARMRDVKNPNVFDIDRLTKIVPLFRGATLDVEGGFKSAIRTLYDCGVTVIVESYVTQTHIRGGTFISSDGKPYIFLTKHPPYYDTLWFALLHELCHVLFDLDIIRSGIGSHLTGGDPDLFFEDEMIERTANNFAARMLLPEDGLEYATKIIHNRGFIQQAARDWNVHPSIIYGMYCKATNDPTDFARFGHFRLYADEAIKFTYNSWQKNSLAETTPIIEKQLIGS